MRHSRNFVLLWKFGLPLPKLIANWPDHFSATERNLAEALYEFLEATRVAPDWGEGHLWCGNVLQEMLRMDEAAVRYKEAIRLMPGDARTHIRLAPV